MGIKAQHPVYVKQVDTWKKCRDVLEGEDAVKAPDNIVAYLPPPPGMAPNPQTLSEKSTQNDRYSFYASFAELPEITQPMAEGIQGMIHDRPPKVELPSSLAYLKESATADGRSLQELWQHITREIFHAGRISLLADLQGGNTVTGDRLYLCPYVAESLINWRLDPSGQVGNALMVVLHETHWRNKDDDEYEMEEVDRWLELRLDPETSRYSVRLHESVRGKDPVVVPQDDSDADGWFEPSLRGKAFEEIPVTVINAQTRGFEYGPVPVWSLAKRALAIFRKSADFNRSLYIKGDPQVVVTGARKNEVGDEIGGGSAWIFTNHLAKAYYLDIEGDGIPLQAKAIEAEYDRFYSEAGHLLETKAKGVEAAEALRMRQAMKQVTVKSLVQNAGDGLEEALRSIGRLQGMKDSELEKISFIPNLDFAEKQMAGRDLLEMMQAKNQGAPLSLETVHAHMRRRQMTDLDLDEELENIKNEEPLLGMMGRDDTQSVEGNTASEEKLGEKTDGGARMIAEPKQGTENE